MRIFWLKGGYLHLRLGSAWVVVSRHGVDATWAKPTQTEPVAFFVRICAVVAGITFAVGVMQ